jgi:hypothetical protein
LLSVMGLFALLTRFLPRLTRRADKPQFSAAPLAPCRLERRRVFDGAAPGLMLEAIPDTQPFVQAGEFFTATDSAEQEGQVAALNGFPQTTIRLRDAELFENQSTLAVIEIRDSSPMAHEVTIDWGDGSPLQVINAGPQQRDVLAVHQFRDDNPTATASDTYTVTATVKNTLGETVSTSATILVKNVSPKIDTLTLSTPVDENGTATLSGTYSDVGSLDTHQLDIDWDGDGTFDQTATVTGGNFSITHQFLDDNPTGTASDTFNVNVRLRDDDDGEAVAAREITVRNVAPSITNLAVSSPVLENGTATLTGSYTDVGTQDTHQLDIDWDGDGTDDQTVTVSSGNFSVTHQYLDDNPTGTASDAYNINVRLRDDDGGEDADSTSITVQNVNPVVVLNPLAIISENGTATVTGTYTDAGTQDTHQLDIDWDGDGVFEQTVVVTGGAFTVTRQFLDDNPTGTSSDTHDVNIRLRDDDGGITTASRSLTVVNVSPAITNLTVTTPIDENGTATLTGSYSDPGTQDTHQLDIDWDGDGNFDQAIAVTGGNFSVTHQFLDDNPTGTPSDTYNVTVRLRDDDAGQASRSVPLTVRNVTPTLSGVTVTSPIVENGTATLTGNYTDVGTQDTHQLDIDWDGDGTFDQTVNVTGGNFSVTHQYLDDNPTGTASDTFDVNVRLRDDDGGQATASTPITIQNANPVVTLNAIATISENGTATLTGTYTDPGTQDTHELDIDWDDDGTFDQTVIVTGGAFTVTRQFLDDNPTGTSSDTHDVNVRLRDDDGGIATATRSLTVINFAPSITNLAVSSPVLENGMATLTGTYTDPGTQDTHQLDIDWDGDGTFDQTVTVTDGNFSITHQYLDDNPTGTPSDTFNVTVRLRDDDTGQTMRSVLLTVVNVAPTITNLAVTTPIDENGTATLTGSYSDPGTQDTHQLDIDWDGDGTFDQTIAITGGSFSVTHQYLDDNPAGTPSDTFNVTVRLGDDDTGQASRSIPLTVRNVAPILSNVAVTSPIVENGTATLTGTYTDVGTQDTHQLDIDWDGNGTFDQTVMVTGGNFSVTHQYLDDNPTSTPSDTFNINVRLRDDDGGQASATTPITIQNANPVVTLNTVATINENGTATLTGTYIDVGTQDTHQLDIDWDGNGSFDQTVLVSGGAFTVTRQFLDDNPTGTASDTFNINVRLRDDDGGVSADSKPLTVQNVNPSVTLTPPQAINEDETAVLTGTITDIGTQDTFTLTVNWGDPQSPNNIQTFSLGTTPLTQATNGIIWDPISRTFSIEHQYLDDNPTGGPVNIYTIQVGVTDDDTGTATAQTSITVRNLDLVLQLAANQTLSEGANLDLTGGQLGTFTDNGTQDTHTATVDWGDGSGTQAVTVTEASGSGTLSANHTFADNGVYTVRVTVIDDDGGSVSSTFEVTVNNVNPTLTGVVTPKILNEGQLINLGMLGVGVEDPGFDNPNNPLSVGGSRETLTAVSVDWGDGTAPQTATLGLETDGGVGVTTKAPLISGNHAYADDGIYTVSVVIRDDDGSQVTRTFTIEVRNVDPTLQLTNRVLQMNEGSTLTLNDLGIFSDPGFNNGANPNGPSVESFHYSVDWGDGTLTENNQAPATVVDGGQGVLTTGTLTDSHFYADNDDDNFYTITVTLFDDDGGSHTQQIQVRVLNVNPTLFPLVATDVNTKGIATVTVTFNDPGVEPQTVHIDWGDNRPDVITLPPATAPTTYTFVHQYLGPPDPLNPAADITISVFVRDDDFGIAGVADIGESNTETVTISNPGIGGEPFRIDTTPQVPSLTFPMRAEAPVVPFNAGANVAFQQNVEIYSTSGDTQAVADRYVELRVIDAEGKEGPGYRLRPEVLQDLPGLFRSLPDNHYAIYVVNMETNTSRLVIEVYVRNGKLIDPGDDSEGTRDRPPTDEQTTEPAVGTSEEQSEEKTAPAAAVRPAPKFPTHDSASAAAKPAFPNRSTRWATLAVGLAASASSQNWAKQVDQALAKATAQQWRKLQGYNPSKRKKQ